VGRKRDVGAERDGAVEEDDMRENGKVAEAETGGGGRRRETDERRGSEGCKQPWPGKQTDGPETSS